MSTIIASSPTTGETYYYIDPTPLATLTGAPANFVDTGVDLPPNAENPAEVAAGHGPRVYAWNTAAAPDQLELDLLARNLKRVERLGGADWPTSWTKQQARAWALAHPAAVAYAVFYP